MKFTNQIDIALPRVRVIELFDDPKKMKHWQPDLISFEPVSGTPGQPGAKSRLRYKTGSREFEMIETITVRNLPDEFSGTYDAKGMHNAVRNLFTETSATSTRWTAEQEFIMSGLMMRLMAVLMPGVIRKNCLKFMEKFKEFAERAS